MRTSTTALAAALLLAGGLSACSVAGASDTDETVTIGYQSKTINTVTAGTLLRERGYFEKRLAEIDPDLKVDWQDYDTGAPITAQMLAGKIDIGSMGDYPLLINGSRAGTDDDGDSMVAVTGYNLHGALNGVVVGADSDAQTLEDLEGGDISASVGSAGHGTLVQALDALGLDPAKDVTVENQDPPVGASALEAGSVDAVVAVRRLARAAHLPRRRAAGLRRRPARPPHLARHGDPQPVRRGARRHRRGLPRGPDRRHELPARAPHGGGADRRRRHRAPAGGGLPLQRSQRRLHLRRDAQEPAARRARPRRAVPQVRRRAAGPARPRRLRRRQLHQGRLRRGLRPGRGRHHQPGRDHRHRRGLPGAGRRSGHGRRAVGDRRGRHQAGGRPHLPAAQRGRGRGGRREPARGVHPRRDHRHPLVRRPHDLAAATARRSSRSPLATAPTSTPPSTRAPRS